MIGTILRNMRKTRNKTQTEIGKKLNVAENTISNYETEYSCPNFDTVIKYAKECNFDIEFIDKKTKKHYTVDEISKEWDF